MIKPVSYFEMLWLLQNCSIVCTDSGGLQKEAYFHSKPCITLRNETEWIELIHNGWNVLSGYEITSIKSAFNYDFKKRALDLYGDGSAANLIVNEVEKYLK